MFSVKPIAIGMALAVAGVAGAAQAGVVVASSGPSAGKYKPGTQLDDASRITLKEGDSVTVMSGARTRVIKGPGTHRVGARGASKRSTFAVLTRQRSSQRVRTGAVRGTGGTTETARSPNLWYVDVSRSGTMCVATASSVRLWRPESEGDSTYVVANAASPDHVHVAFNDGEMDTPWDIDRMPLSDGASYTISAQDGGAESAITFRVLEEVPDDPEALAQSLIENGCSTQLELLASALS